MSDTVLTGMSFPFRIDQGGVMKSSGADKVDQNIIHLLSVRLGERTMLRTYGGGVHGRREQPNSSVLAALVRHEIETALRTQIPDLRLTAPLNVIAREERLVVQIEYAAAPGDILRRLEVQLP